MKITNEQVAKCMAGFDFEKVAALYHFMEWKWSDGTPNKESLIDLAYHHLKTVQREFKGRKYSIGSGGLRAYAYTAFEGSIILELEFVAHSSLA
jgi:hypothetical protein